MLKKRFLICLALLVALLVANLVMIQAATSSDLTFTLNDEGTGYVVSKCNPAATGSLSIPATYNGKPVVEIGSEAFLECTSLTSVTIPNSVKTIGWYSFSGCTKLTSISIPDSVTTIDWFAFSGCTSLTSVTIGNGVADVGSAAFAGCSKLTTVTLGNSVTTIGQSAFKYCSQLSTINIPGSVTSIARYAFYGCDNLSSVTFCGTSQNWNKLIKEDGNTVLASVSVKYHQYTNCVCSICSATNHNMQQSAAEVAPTCENPGKTATFTCANGCGKTEGGAKIDALGHNMTQTAEAIAPTCENPGKTAVETCSACGTTIGGDEIAALDHNMVESEAAVDATCETAGKTAVMTCANGCGLTTGGDEIPATGHNYVDGTCSCGATEGLTDSKLVLYKTNTSGGDLLLGDDIRASFIVNAKSLSYDRIYLEIVLNGEATIVDKLDTSTATVLRYAYVIPAAYMTTDITVTVYGVKGEDVYRGEVLEYSVRKCIDAKMVNWVKANSTANCNLAMALLHYGARAQIQFNINTDYLATDNLPEEYQQYLPSAVPTLGTTPTVDTTGKTMTIFNMGTLLQEKVKLSTIFRSTTAISDYSKITIEVKHHRSKDGEEIIYTYTSADTSCVEFVNNKNIRFYFDKIAPSQMRDELDITVYYDDVAVSATYVRSVDMILNNNNYLSNENMCALVYAIMNYGDAAKAVFG